MALNVDQWTFLSIMNIADQFKDVSIQILVDYIGQIHYHVGFEFIKGTREKLHLFHLVARRGAKSLTFSVFISYSDRRKGKHSYYCVTLRIGKSVILKFFSY